MALRALLCSKNSETNTAMSAACYSAGIRAEVCPDIFSAIEKGKTQPFSCVIADWADQPEASFLLRRARESEANRETVAIAVVDREPSAAEMRDNRLKYLIYRPISAEQAAAVLSQACEQMQPVNTGDAEELTPPRESNAEAVQASTPAESSQSNQQPVFAAATAQEPAADEEAMSKNGADEQTEPPQHRSSLPMFRVVLAAALVITAGLCAWRAHETIQYLSQTREDRSQIFRESVAAFFNLNDAGVVPAPDAQQDAYFNRGSSRANGQAPALGVVSTESSVPDEHPSLSKAADFPLPVPTIEHHDVPPMQHQQAAIPESMKDSPPIAPPVVVAVNPAQMMPVSAPPPQPAAQPFSEPVALSEEAARALLIHTVNPEYPPAALAQKLHGPVVLQATISRDGSVEDLKIVRGYFVLGQAAIAAVKQWRFQPYTLNGHAAATQTQLTINFSNPG